MASPVRWASRSELAMRRPKVMGAQSGVLHMPGHQHQDHLHRSEHDDTPTQDGTLNGHGQLPPAAWCSRHHGGRQSDLTRRLASVHDRGRGWSEPASLERIMAANAPPGRGAMGTPDPGCSAFGRSATAGCFSAARFLGAISATTKTELCVMLEGSCVKQELWCKYTSEE